MQCWTLQALRDNRSHRGRARYGVVVPSLLALCACLADGAGELVGTRDIPEPTIRDSAGVRIVEYATLRDAPAAFRIEREPYLELGGLRAVAEEELDHRTPFLNVVELSDGTIVVNDFTRLKYFSRGGTFLRSAGRHGSGPGEFSEAREICLLHGDFLLVIDGGDGRLSLWDREGRHVQTWARPGFVPLGGCTVDGAVIVRAQDGASTNALGERFLDFSLRRLNGSLVRELGPLPAFEYTGPIIREPSYVLVGDELYVGDAKTFEVRVFGPDRALRRMIRVRDGTKSLTEEEWHSMVDAMTPQGARPFPQVAALRERLLSGPRPAAFPAYWRMRIDPLHRVWLDEYMRPSHLTVFDSTGRLLGVVDLPAPAGWLRAEVAGLAADHIVVRVFDEDRAQRLRFHRISESRDRRTR